MAPAATHHLSIAEYEKLYDKEAGWEYWFGEARRKPVPTQLHGLLQILLADLLRLAGYISITESDLRIVDDWRPRPDVYGVLGKLEGLYATRPVDVVFEVSSDGDDILTKCKHYTEILIPAIFVFDPDAQTITSWDGTKLVPVTDVKLGNGVTITGATIWREFAKRLQPPAPPISMTI
jgi:Uma2 family endonuclease